MARIGGLDISTTTAGWAVLEDGEIVEKGYYDFDKPDNYDLIDLAEQFEEEILPVLEGCDKIVLEAALKKYGGMTSNTSVTVLLQFNAIVELLLQRKLGRERIVKVHPSTAKKAALGRGRKPKGYDGSGKDWVLEQVGERYDIEWPRTRYDNIRRQMEDVADSIVLALAYHNDPAHVTK